MCLWKPLAIYIKDSVMVRVVMLMITLAEMAVQLTGSFRSKSLNCITKHISLNLWNVSMTILYWHLLLLCLRYSVLDALGLHSIHYSFPSCDFCLFLPLNFQTFYTLYVTFSWYLISISANNKVFEKGASACCL